jgi:hypothetical protein
MILRALIFIFALGLLFMKCQDRKLAMKRPADVDRTRRDLAYRVHLEREYRKEK